jgi:hypothetical protein
MHVCNIIKADDLYKKKTPENTNIDSRQLLFGPSKLLSGALYVMRYVANDKLPTKRAKRKFIYFIRQKRFCCQSVVIFRGTFSKEMPKEVRPTAIDGTAFRIASLFPFVLRKICCLIKPCASLLPESTPTKRKKIGQNIQM